MSRGNDARSVLIGDPEPLFVEVVATTLRELFGMDVPDLRTNSDQEVLDAVARTPPDVVLVDLWLPAMGAGELTRRLTGVAPACKVIVLSSYYGVSQIREALQAGAFGFLPKGIAVHRLAEAVFAAASGRPLVFGEELAGRVQELDERWDSESATRQAVAGLSAREMSVLELLAQGYRPDDIAEELALTVGTVRNHIHAILKKTGARSTVEAVAILLRTGRWQLPSGGR